MGSERDSQRHTTRRPAPAGLRCPLDDLCAPRPLQPGPAMTNEVQQAREALGYRLGAIRKDARVSGRQLAALAGWHFTKVSKIEHGRSMPSNADIELWCFHCGAESQIADLTAA